MKKIYYILITLCFSLASCTLTPDTKSSLIDECLRSSAIINQLSLNSYGPGEYEKVLKLAYEVEAICTANNDNNLEVKLDRLKYLNNVLKGFDK